MHPNLNLALELAVKYGKPIVHVGFIPAVILVRNHAWGS